MADMSFLPFRNRSVRLVSALMAEGITRKTPVSKKAYDRVITSGYNLLSELLSLQKTPYVILLAQSADNVTYQYIARG